MDEAEKKVEKQVIDLPMGCNPKTKTASQIDWLFLF